MVTDLRQLLRYYIPGSIAELLFGVWLYFDAREFGGYGEFPELGGTGAAALAVGAAPAIGFISAAIAHQFKWCPALFRNVRDEHLLRIDGDLAAASRTRAERSAAVEVILEQRADAHPRSVDRARAHLDQENGLAAAAIACLLAMLLMVAVLIATSDWLGGTSIDTDRMKVWVPMATLDVAAAAFFWHSQGRVSELAELLISEIFRRS